MTVTRSPRPLPSLITLHNLTPACSTVLPVIRCIQTDTTRFDSSAHAQGRRAMGVRLVAATGSGVHEWHLGSSRVLVVRKRNRERKRDCRSPLCVCV